MIPPPFRISGYQCHVGLYLVSSPQGASLLPEFPAYQYKAGSKGERQQKQMCKCSVVSTDREGFKENKSVLSVTLKHSDLIKSGEDGKGWSGLRVTLNRFSPSRFERSGNYFHYWTVRVKTRSSRVTVPRGNTQRYLSHAYRVILDVIWASAL